MNDRAESLDFSQKHHFLWRIFLPLLFLMSLSSSNNGDTVFTFVKPTYLS